MIAVIGAGAMGAALAFVHARAGVRVALLGTRFDDATVEVCRAGLPHPALGVPLPTGVDCRPHSGWGAVLPNAERVLLGISSDGLADVVEEIAPRTKSGAVWIVATKGWDPETLRTPSEVIGAGRTVVVLAGPALAPELVAGAPTAMVCASRDVEAAQRVSDTLIAGGISTMVTDDVEAVEVAAAYKNVTAIAVGMCEGMSERLAENVFIHRFANARAAMFAQGLRDMMKLAPDGRPETIFGLAGAGDLYVTCLGGRNGNFGRLLGSGQTPAQAQKTIGSTVEGVINTQAALAIADKLGVELLAARAVDDVLSERSTPEEAIKSTLAAIGTTA